MTETEKRHRRELKAMKKVYEEKEKQMKRDFKDSNPSHRAKALETLYYEKEKAFSSLRKNHDNDKMAGGNIQISDSTNVHTNIPKITNSDFSPTYRPKLEYNRDDILDQLNH